MLICVNDFLKIEDNWPIVLLYQSVGERHSSLESFAEPLGLIRYFLTERLNHKCAFSEIAHPTRRVEIFNLVTTSEILGSDVVYLHILVGNLPTTVGTVATVFVIDSLTDFLGES